jgi:HD-GYP domain-containing protein (c-di-GMP phosphodiesterase class II)
VSDVPILARIRNSCDIFDAVSAADRPHKKAMPFERALEIPAAAVEDGQIDRNLFLLFLGARVYERWQIEPHPY